MSDSGSTSTTVEDGFEGRRVLVAGGAGFLGSNLALRLVGLGARVVVADNFASGLGGNAANLAGFASRITLVRTDLAAHRDWAGLLRGVDCVFSLAGRNGHHESMLRPQADLVGNCRPALRLLEACREHRPGAVVVYAGTRQIYGRTPGGRVDEDCPPAPPDLNAVHKLAADLYHRVYHDVHGLRTRVLRLTNTYGPRMRIRDARLNFLGDWTRRLLAGREIRVWGGGQRRDYAYVDDVCEALLRLAATPGLDGHRFNLGGSAVVTHDELARACLSACGGCGRVVHEDPPPERRRIDIGDFETDDRRFRAATGWRPVVTLAEGLRRTFDYFRPRLADYTKR